MAKGTGNAKANIVRDWNFAQVWNDSLLTYKDKRPFAARDYMYASELGGAMIDRYLKMTGVKPSNLPNNRSLRKFQAGNIWEWIVAFVLKRAGILKNQQVRAYVELPGCIRVSGKSDFIAGGAMDWDRAKFEVDRLDLPEIIYYACLKIIESLKQQYKGVDFVQCVFECKSVSSFVFERIKRINRPNGNHDMQLFHYVIGTPEDENGITYNNGKLCYVCRDDCRLKEFDIYDSAVDIRERYYEDVKMISDYYQSKTKPPKEKELIFDEFTCKFSKNWKVEYSNYLTKIYKYKTPEEYREQFESTARSYNYTFKRCVNGDRMTDKNNEVIREAKKKFPKWDTYVDVAKTTGILALLDEEDDD